MDLDQYFDLGGRDIFIDKTKIYDETCGESLYVLHACERYFLAFLFIFASASSLSSTHIQKPRSLLKFMQAKIVRDNASTHLKNREKTVNCRNFYDPPTKKNKE